MSFKTQTHLQMSYYMYFTFLY